MRSERRTQPSLYTPLNLHISITTEELAEEIRKTVTARAVCWPLERMIHNGYSNENLNVLTLATKRQLRSKDVSLYEKRRKRLPRQRRLNEVKLESL